MSHDDADQVVVCGGGIIGVGAAYYLTLQGVKPLLIERTAIACGASGPDNYLLETHCCI